MKTTRIGFGLGEEKLEKAFELIVGLQKELMAFAQRVEVDRLVMAALLAGIPEPEATLSRWRAMMAEYYPGQLLDHMSSEHMGKSSDALKRQAAYWTKTIESLARSGSGLD